MPAGAFRRACMTVTKTACESAAGISSKMVLVSKTTMLSETVRTMTAITPKTGVHLNNPPEIKKEEEKPKYTVVVIDNGNSLFGLTVDRIISQEQIMVKKLDKSLKNIKGISGNTILGDGSVGLIIDVNTLI